PDGTSETVFHLCAAGKRHARREEIYTSKRLSRLFDRKVAPFGALCFCYQDTATDIPIRDVWPNQCVQTRARTGHHQRLLRRKRSCESKRMPPQAANSCGGS